jgi:hypothetical protein
VVILNKLDWQVLTKFSENKGYNTYNEAIDVPHSLKVEGTASFILQGVSMSPASLKRATE